jgi:hypothetical protein
MVNLRVVDIYHGDRVSNFKKAADFGIWGIIQRRQQGRPGRTPSIRLVANRQAMRGSFGEPILGHKG